MRRQSAKSQGGDGRITNTRQIGYSLPANRRGFSAAADRFVNISGSLQVFSAVRVLIQYTLITGNPKKVVVRLTGEMIFRRQIR